jgi:hypothetical protein
MRSASRGTMPGADPRALLDAAFAELDAAIEALTKLAETDLGEAAPAGQADSLSAERACCGPYSNTRPRRCSCSSPTARCGARTARPAS